MVPNFWEMVSQRTLSAMLKIESNRFFHIHAKARSLPNGKLEKRIEAA
jgi:hypothetical protein